MRRMKVFLQNRNEGSSVCQDLCGNFPSRTENSSQSKSLKQGKESVFTSRLSDIIFRSTENLKKCSQKSICDLANQSVIIIPDWIETVHFFCQLQDP